MEWKVQNALNRDVERQHLNKILKEIRQAVDTNASQSSGAVDVKPIVGEMVEGNTEEGLSVTYNPVQQVLNFAVNDFIIRLSGDVSGQATVSGLRSINIVTSLEDTGFIQDAPVDGFAYWRRVGEWEPVGTNLEDLQQFYGLGFVVRSGSYGTYVSREIEGEAGEIEVSDGDGIASNPVIGLSDVVPAVGGTMKTTTFDSKGRRIEEEEADTDNLPEGISNLYHTTERAQDAVGSILIDSDHISFVYDDDVPSIIAELTNDNLVSIAEVIAADGDILEWQGIDNEWESTKSPRLLHLDGGNF